MTQDQVIAAADECGIPISKTFGPMIGAAPVGDLLSRFYAIAYRQGMEGAAEICDALQDIPATEPRHCAEDIRVRAQNQPKNVHDGSVV